MREILNHLFNHKTLDRKEAEKVLTNIAKGIYSESEIAAFLTVYLMRSITVEELSGFRDALLNLCVRTDLGSFDTIDVCGTGGDGKETFNISTLTTHMNILLEGATECKNEQLLTNYGNVLLRGNNILYIMLDASKH